MVKDDMVFKPYNCPKVSQEALDLLKTKFNIDLGNNGYQCLMKIGRNTLSVRYGSRYLLTDARHPYEVMDLEGDVYGYRTADDIFNYLRTKQW